MKGFPLKPERKKSKYTKSRGELLWPETSKANGISVTRELVFPEAQLTGSTLVEGGTLEVEEE